MYKHNVMFIRYSREDDGVYVYVHLQGETEDTYVLRLDKINNYNLLTRYISIYFLH